MKCHHCEENEARYLNAAREALCSLCDMVAKPGCGASIRISDLPYLLVLVDQLTKDNYLPIAKQIRGLLGIRD